MGKVEQAMTDRPDFKTLYKIMGIISVAILAWSVIILTVNGGSDLQGGSAKGDAMAMNNRFEGNITAPDFPGGLEWLNTDRPLSLEDLRGRLVLLDFWTFCCINCMHVIPDLKKLETKYPDELVVIGVHSAKFANERQTQSIRQAILRYEIEHPVVNDRDFQIWTQYAVRAWPTLMLINPKGKIIGGHSGEGVFDAFDTLISQAIGYFDARGEMTRRPLDLPQEKDRAPQSILSFPGKISADSARGHLFITDSNHNRVIVIDSTGRIVDIIGSSRSGRVDGDFEAAEFNHPQGTCLDGNILYIADTENHTIRAADLSSRRVQTILGTGLQAREFNVPGTGIGVALNSPWDVMINGGIMYIAMAGSHQLWQVDLKTTYARPFAGSGREEIIDGSHLRAALAQPSGLAIDGKKVYFADSETSSIRSATIDFEGGVETLVGEGLFDFGDVDGPLSNARLQHPLGVAVRAGLIYVADTYNSKIKIIDPAGEWITTLAGSGRPGDADGPLLLAEFNEPGGLAFLNEKLYIADVNNHRIRVIDLSTKEVQTLELRGVEMLSRRLSSDFKGRQVQVAEKTIRPGEGSLSVSVYLPPGYILTTDAPAYVECRSEDESVLNVTDSNPGSISSGRTFPYLIPVTAASGRTRLILDAVIYYCEPQSRLCHLDQIRLMIPITVHPDGESRIEARVDVRRPGVNE